MDQDRERLKEVHATDLTESRINEDFLDWLKNKGPTYLLVILVAVTAYLAVVRWKMHKQQQVDDAWTALRDAALPSSKLDVADMHPDQFAVPQLALQSAGSQLLRSVQTNRAVDAAAITSTGQPDPTAAPELTPEEREEYLQRADEAFARIQQLDDGSLSMTLHALRAINGRAAVAEARGDSDAARSFYEEAANRAETFYPRLGEQARTRAENVDDNVREIAFESGGSVTPGLRAFEAPLSPATIDPVLSDLLVPAENAGS
jgi:hypothetical protein